MHVVIGTAGHIDHGKSALVRALTGTDPDRLKVEKERGMTTELGFAFYSPNVTIIDVPGHEKFVRHMLAGATTIDLVLLVVAADDGIMPQTIEHFEITRLLGIKQGLIAITKRDLVEDDWLAMIKTDVAELVKGSYLEGAPMVAVSSITGEGVDRLRAELDRLIAGAPPKPDKGVFRLPIDRSFTMKGFGTVIAGTVLSGSARVGDRVELLPEGVETRIRGIQVHNHPVAVASLGERAALNLQGIERGEALRGSVTATPGYYHPSELLNANLYLLKNAGAPLKNMTRLRLHIGTAEIMCRVMLLDVKELLPGHQSVVQIRLESPTVADWGDRYVIRTYSPQRTIGGGTILEAAPQKARRFDKELLTRLNSVGSGSAASVVEQHLLKEGFTAKNVEQIAREVAYSLTDTTRIIDEMLNDGRVRRVEAEGKHLFVHAGALLKARNLILDALATFHRDNPARLGMKRQELKSKLPREFSPLLYDRMLESLAGEQSITTENERIHLFEHVIRLDERERALAGRIQGLLEETGFNTPGLKDLPTEVGETNTKRVDKVLTALLDQGQVIDLGEGVVMSRSAVERAEKLIRAHFADHPQMTASEFRQMVDTSRKYAIPLLNYFDSHGLTQRMGDVRVPRKQRV